jgi:hypothetical protein
MFRGIFISGLVLCWGLAAATLQQLSVDQMTQSATAVVRARVTASSAKLTGNTIYTHYSLQVTERWKGFAPLEVMLPGGTVNGQRQAFPGVPQLTVGTEYLMFLWTSTQTGITHLVGLSQGLFNITAATDGTLTASRPLIGEMILDDEGRKVADHAVQMPLDLLKSQVTHVLARGSAQ